MNSRTFHRLLLASALPLFLVMAFAAKPVAAQSTPVRPQGPCDIYAAAGDPCVAADSTTRALYASYRGPLYQVMRQSDGKKLNIGVVEPTATDPGGYADAAAQDKFCANTYCWISIIYDQSPKHNNLTQPPRGGWSGPALAGMDNLPLAEMAPVTLHGHKVYGVFIEPGMGMRDDDPSGTAVDDQAEGQYWVVNGHHFNDGCCFDYGNAEIDSRDDDAGTMEATYFGDATPWYHGKGVGPWIMTDQENNLVGCVNKGTSSKLCVNLPTSSSRFVTGIAKGEPHHWSSMGGDSQHGALSVIYSGPRIDSTYDPMRKQGAILLGNGGDNSNGSQGTFYEGAMTAAGTYPTNATDQLVQANIVAAGYAAPPLVIAPASATAAPTGLQTFSPHSSRQTTLTFTNTTGSAVSDVTLSLHAPARHWTVVVYGSDKGSKTFAGPVAPGATVSVTFRVTSGRAAFNGDLSGRAWWTSAASGHKDSFGAIEKVRNVAPVRINEFRISSGSPANSTNSFIELYNPARQSVNLSDWTLTEHPTQQAIFSAIKIPAGTTLAPGGFYLIGLSDSGLAAPANAGDKVIHVRSVAGMSVGDSVRIGAGASAETRKIASLGTAAANQTSVWQPLPDGPIISVPAGSTNVPVMSVAGFVVGQKIALGYGATYPAVARDLEKYEVATVTAVGKPGVQDYLAADATAGSTNIKVTSVDDISVGDRIRLDINSVGHGIETITVKHVGTAASRTNLAAAADKGATSIQVRDSRGFAAGDKIIVGDPATWTTVTVTSVGARGRHGATLGVTPALTRDYATGQGVVAPGTGLDLEAPLKFNHSANLPFSDRGTGITFEPAAAFAHSSDEPVQALGTGITLDRPLARSYGVNAVVEDAAVKTAGYHGAHAPQQWFGGPEFVTKAVLFGRYPVTYRQGSMVLRDSTGDVVDSLNYGELVDPWAAEGYQGVSGQGHGGCFAPTPGSGAGNGPFAAAFGATNISAGRYPDGADTDSNCNDFFTQTASTLAAPAAAGVANVKVLSVDGFVPGKKVMIGEGAKREDAVIATVGTAGATTLRTAIAADAKVIPVVAPLGFTRGQAITIGSGANAETSAIASIRRYGPAAIIVTSALSHAHAAGAPVTGSGITLAAPLTHAHTIGTQIGNDVPTPGTANQYSRK